MRVDIPKALEDLAPKGRGRAFYRAVLREFDVGSDAYELVCECARMLDELDRLGEIVAREGLTQSTGRGEGRVHPVQVERRLLRGELRLALTRLGFPDDEGEDWKSRRARRAAEARWSD